MSKLSVGLDIGGSKISGVLFDGKIILRRLRVSTPKTKKDFIIAIARLCELLSFQRRVENLGIGVAGVLDAKREVVKYSPNLKYLSGVNLKKIFADKIKNIVLENDANCFALAESRFGVAKKLSNFVGVTLGTGVGGGIIINKNIYRGSHGSAGEVGHIMADFRYECERYFKEAKNKKDFKLLGQTIGILLANIFNMIDCEAVVFGGGIALAYKNKFIKLALITAKRHILNQDVQVKVIFSKLKDAGAIGAALVSQRL